MPRLSSTVFAGLLTTCPSAVIGVNWRNAWQNAKFTADMLRPKRVNHILLVTSALHKSRAVALFEAQCIKGDATL